MHVLRQHALLLSAVLAIPAAANAASSVTALPALVEQAWLRSPTSRGLTSRQGEIDAARDLSGSWIAGTPVFGLSQRNGLGNAQESIRESDVTLSAPFWTPGQRTARRRLADYSATELQAHLRKLRLDIAGEVRTRLWDVAAAQALLEEKEGHLHHTEELAEEVWRRVKAGELARVDGLLTDQEVQAARTAVEQAKGGALISKSRLATLTGSTAPLSPEPESISSAAGALDARVEAARATESRAQAALRLARVTRSAPPTLSVSMRNERDRLQGAPERSVGVALQVPLGSAGRNRPAEAQAQTHIAIAAAEAQQAAEVTRVELDLATRQLEHTRVALAAARARVDAMREHQRLIEKAFRLGERGLADLLRSRALAHEAQVAQRQQQVALGRAHAQFNQASGVLP